MAEYTKGSELVACRPSFVSDLDPSARLVFGARSCPGAVFAGACGDWIDRWLGEEPLLGKRHNLNLTPGENEFLQNQGTTNEKGRRIRHLYLTSADGVEFRAPISTADLIQGEQVVTPETGKPTPS